MSPYLYLRVLVFLEKVMAWVLVILKVINLSVHQPALESISDIQSSNYLTAEKVLWSAARRNFEWAITLYISPQQTY